MISSFYAEHFLLNKLNNASSTKLTVYSVDEDNGNVCRSFAMSLNKLMITASCYKSGKLMMTATCYESSRVNACLITRVAI